MTFDSQKAKDFIEGFWTSSLQPSLEEYIKIPNTSRNFDPEWNTNGKLLEAATHMVNWVKGLNIQGITIEILKHADKSPLIFIDIPGTTNTDTCLLYGHFDKQPPFTGWMEGFGPCIPKQVGDKLYGRGGADDGYAIYASMTAIKICKDQGLPLPRIVVTIEGDEESGSAHFPAYVQELKDRIGTIGVVYCLDSGAAAFDTLYVTTSLRGCVVANLTVKVLNEGVHSGEASGIVPSSFRIARHLLERIENSATGELIPEFQVDIPQDSLVELKNFADSLGPSLLTKFKTIGEPVTLDTFQLAVNNGWKALMEVVGADGFPPTQIAGNVMRPETTLKISIRTPPTADPIKIGEILKQKLEENPPYGASVNVKVIGAMGGWKAPKNQPWLDESISNACVDFFGKKSLSMAQGGSIPLMGMLLSQFPSSQFAVIGILGPDTNAHGPNEFLHIPMTKRLIGVLAKVLSESYTHLKK